MCIGFANISAAKKMVWPRIIQNIDKTRNPFNDARFGTPDGANNFLYSYLLMSAVEMGMWG
jgi:hypothetical protein